MKAFKGIVVFCLIFFNFLIKGKSQAPSAGLEAYYPFSGNANDVSGKGRNAGIGGGVTLTIDRNGNANSAYSFNGVNGAISATWGILSGNSDRTVSLWFKTLVPSNTQYMVSWGTPTADQMYLVGTYFDPSSNRVLGLLTYGAAGMAVINQFQFYDNRWHHIVVTQSASLSKLYLDGALQTSRVNNPVNTGSSQLTIGSLPTGGSGYFSGSLDDVRIYNRGLSDSEIIQLYLAEVPNTSNSEILKLGTDKLMHLTGPFSTHVGIRAGAFSNATASTFFGYQAGMRNTGGFNVFNGAFSGESNTSGSGNVFLGTSAGQDNTIGSSNLFVGNSSGRFNITGSENVLLGYDAGWKSQGNNNTIIGKSAGGWLTSGNDNTIAGWNAGIGRDTANNTASKNTIFGSKSGIYITSGSNNVFSGWASGFENTTGNDNTAIGTQAGGLNKVGAFNTSLGKLAGYDNVSGSNNTFIGAGANTFGTNKASIFSSSAIGSNAKVSINNAIVLGDFQNNDLRVGIGVHDPQHRLDVRGVINMRAAYNSPSLKINNKDFLGIDDQGEFWVSNFKMKFEDESKWADRVFNPTYRLTPINEVIEYIGKNQHLPGIPSGKEVAKDGVELQLIISKLLEKIEELTLYSYEQNVELQRVKARLLSIEKTVEDK